jgi:hypothetical protein
MRNDRTCARCGQSIADVRHGVKLTHFKARILDAIERAGPDGIGAHDLFVIVFANDSRPHTLNTLKAHIFQINQALIGTGLHIFGRGGGWRLHRNQRVQS